MKRKVNLVGNSTLTVSLPSQFIKNNDINKGDELDIELDGNKIIYSIGNNQQEDKEITINLDNQSLYSLFRYLTIIYRMNYKKVILTFSKPELLYERGKIPLFSPSVRTQSTINFIIQRFVGAEIISQTANKVVIEFFIADGQIDFDKIEKRIFFLIKETLNDLFQATEKEFKLFYDTIHDRQDNIIKFINYYLRELNFANWGDHKKKMIWSSMIFLEQIVRKIRYLSENINKFGCTSKVKNYIKESFDLVSKQVDLIYNTKDIHKIKEMSNNLREKIEKDQFNKKEAYVISELDFFINCHRVFIELGILNELESNENKSMN